MISFASSILLSSITKLTNISFIQKFWSFTFCSSLHYILDTITRNVSNIHFPLHIPHIWYFVLNLFQSFRLRLLYIWIKLLRQVCYHKFHFDLQLLLSILCIFSGCPKVVKKIAIVGQVELVKICLIPACNHAHVFLLFLVSLPLTPFFSSFHHCPLHDITHKKVSKLCENDDRMSIVHEMWLAAWETCGYWLSWCWTNALTSSSIP